MSAKKDSSKVPFTTSIDREIKEQFKIICVMKGKYQSEVVEDLIRNYLSKEGEGEGVGNTNK